MHQDVSMKTFLVALDSSPRAPAVLRAAAELARASDAKLLLFRVVGLPNELPLEAYAMSPDGVIQALSERAQRELDELARVLRGNLPFETKVEIGTPWQAICKAGTAAGAALIVIGSHGYSGIDRLLGTTAARIVNHADRSVLVVRASKSAEERQPA